jgi:hypothetical protein
LPDRGLLAHVLVSKFADHLPLYRQSEIYARQGVEIERSTLAGWVGGASDLLSPWSTRFRSMCSQAASFMQTTRRFRCSRLAAARPRPAGFGLMCAMTGLPVKILHRPSGSRTQKIARANIHGSI